MHPFENMSEQMWIHDQLYPGNTPAAQGGSIYKGRSRDCFLSDAEQVAANKTDEQLATEEEIKKHSS